MARCDCGASLISTATKCPVCKALLDQDKKKAKAKLKAKAKKDMAIKKDDVTVRMTVDSLRSDILGAIDTKFATDPDRRNATIRSLLHVLCQELPESAPVEVEKSMEVTGKDADHGWEYKVSPTV
jgi:hypothetical protein